MAHAPLVLVVLTLAAVGTAQAEKPSCKAEARDAAKLQKEVNDLHAKLNAAHANLDGLVAGGNRELSVLGAVASASNLVGSAIQHALDRTDLDEKASEHLEAARSLSVDAMGKIAAVDYNEHVEKLKQHDIYKVHVAPAMVMAAKKAQPLMIQYVNPVVETHVRPALDKAKAATAQATNTVLPALQQYKTKMFDALGQAPTMLSHFETKLGDVLAPAFDLAAKASPGHATMLPSRAVDRLLFLLVLVVFSYYLLFLAKFIVTVALRFTRKTTWVAFRLAVVMPLSIIARLLSIAVCCATCFYCCGLCRRKRVSVPVPSKVVAKGGTTTGKKETTMPVKVTAEELKQLLEASKKKGKLDDAVKLLCNREKEGKPLEGKSFPENVRGKALDKATLKKAFGNFKEIDMKKL